MKTTRSNREQFPPDNTPAKESGPAPVNNPKTLKGRLMNAITAPARSTREAVRTQPPPIRSSPYRTPKRRFRVHAHVRLPVDIEAIVHANGPEDAAVLAENILHTRQFTDQLHNIVEIQNVSVLLEYGHQVDVRLQSASRGSPLDP